MRQWTFRQDFNNDGIFTISDVFGILQSIFLYPGDFMISYMLNTKLGPFFELSKNDYGGDFSFALSFLGWFLILSTVLLIAHSLTGIQRQLFSKARSYLLKEG